MIKEKMSKSSRIILITISSFLMYLLLDDVLFGSMRNWLNETIDQIGISHILTYIIVGFPIFLGTLLINTRKYFLENLGLSNSFTEGLFFSLLCTQPMFIGYALLFDFNQNISLNRILLSVVAAGVFEELYFRGFLFGQLYRYTRLGFIPSVFLGAVIFGIAHLYQGKELGELIGIFFVTSLGAILFSWVYAEWEYNLWVPIFLHMLMNLSWEMFSAGDTALGDVYSNIFRAVTITLTIVLTIVYKKRKGNPLSINKSTIWIKNNID